MRIVYVSLSEAQLCGRWQQVCCVAVFI